VAAPSNLGEGTRPRSRAFPAWESTTAPRILHYDAVAHDGAQPEAWLLVLHGIYGSGRNWNTVARRVARARSDWGVLLVDLRQHGASRGFEPPHTLAAAAADVQRLIESTDLPVRGVLGHSFGGKVALVHAREHGGELATLWLVDSSPEARSPWGSAWEMLAALRRVPGPFNNRDEGVQSLIALGVAPPVAQWMALNLEPVYENSLMVQWRLDPADMEALLADFFRTDLWSVVDDPPAGLEVHVVKAEESSVVGEAACRRIVEAEKRTARVHLHRVAGGHWVNADNPDALVELLEARLP
jgi:pimeloyl-ACP methyl ester carboxylesterase